MAGGWPLRVSTASINSCGRVCGQPSATNRPSSDAGAQIKTLGGVSSDETLFLRHGNADDPIADDQVVKVRNGMKFESAPDGGVS